MGIYLHFDWNVGRNSHHYSLFRLEDDTNAGWLHVLFVLRVFGSGYYCGIFERSMLRQIAE